MELHRKLSRPAENREDGGGGEGGPVEVLDRKAGGGRRLDSPRDAWGLVLARDRRNGAVRLEHDERGRAERARPDLDVGDEPGEPRDRGQVGREEWRAGSYGQRPLAAFAHVLPSTATGLRNVPIPSISISTSSPGASETGGSRKIPTPAGVPLRVKAPGRSVKTLETCATIARTPKMRPAVVESCSASPFTLCTILRSSASPSSETAAIAGSSGQNVAKLLARSH